MCPTRTLPRPAEAVEQGVLDHDAHAEDESRALEGVEELPPALLILPTPSRLTTAALDLQDRLAHSRTQVASLTRARRGIDFPRRRRRCMGWGRGVRSEQTDVRSTAKISFSLPPKIYI